MSVFDHLQGWLFGIPKRLEPPPSIQPLLTRERRVDEYFDAVWHLAVLATDDNPTATGVSARSMREFVDTAAPPFPHFGGEPVAYLLPATDLLFLALTDSSDDEQKALIEAAIDNIEKARARGGKFR